jgi:predicted RNA binding protein YcfA (HicA-like mRNA interferase family)
MRRAAGKKLQAMRRNPKGDWQIDDIVTVAEAFGFTVRRGGGGHATLSHPNLADILTVPARKPIKPVYVRRLVEAIDRLVGGDE